MQFDAKFEKKKNAGTLKLPRQEINPENTVSKQTRGNLSLS